MKTKKGPEPKMPLQKNSPYDKGNSAVQDDDKKLEVSLLKKNEFALILLGALLLTIIIFFLFFRSSDTKTDIADIRTPVSSFAELEKRIEKIEKAFHLQQKTGQTDMDTSADKLSTLNILKDRVTRLETAFSVKFDSLIERMGKIENSVSSLSNKPVAAIAKKPESKSPLTVKKALKKPSVFHSVQKGETLYSISKQYNTTVPTLRKLNNLSDTAAIYPGNNILVR